VLVQGDIATGAERMVAETVAELGGLDGLVVTAVPIITGALSGASRDDATRSFDVVVNGFRDAVVAAQPYLARRRGSVVAVSSLGSQRYAGYYGALSLAKAALETAVRYLAVELGPSGVRVNAVCPCLIDNPQHFDDAPHVRRFLEKTARRTPLEHRLATPQEIARSIAALIGPDLARVTGQVIVVDGGYSLLG
jgi:NAD(P)-dependent dehydrogenase (short-subunit alcohol dehydrogenase family)